MNPAEKSKAWRLANPEKHLASQAAYRAANREKILARKREHYAENRERLLREKREAAPAQRDRKKAYDTEYRKANLDRLRQQQRDYYYFRLSGTDKLRRQKRRQTALYRARKRNATPPWADLAAINSIYDQCPPGHEVDHIVPLAGATVCGLHIHYNLQYLPIQENRSKSNKLDR